MLTLEKIIPKPYNKSSKSLEDKKVEIEKDLELLDTLGKEQYNRTDKDANVMCKPAHNLMAYALNEERKCSWGIIHK